MNKHDIICFDFETGGKIPGYSEAIQVAGKAYHARSLEPYPPEQGGEFCSLMKPLYFDRLEDEALAINGKTREELEAAPDQKLVWNQFVDWVMRYNPGKSAWTAPIAAGKNIRKFDLLFVEHLNKLHCKKKEKTVLFNRRRELDLEDPIFYWFENSDELTNEKMDTLRDYFGMSRDNAHDALTDCRQTGDLIVRFLKLHRELRRRRNRETGESIIKFKGCFARAA